MTYSFTDTDHADLRSRVRAFAEKHVRPCLPELESTRTVNQDLSRLIAHQGWLGVTVDEEYGGMGAGHLAKTIIIEELSRVCGAMGAMGRPASWVWPRSSTSETMRSARPGCRRWLRVRCCPPSR